MDPGEVSKWSLTFDDAYEEAIRRRERRGEGKGPVDIEAAGNRRLLILHNYRVNTSFPWDRLADRWSTPFPEFKVAEVMEKNTGDGPGSSSVAEG